MHIFYSTNIQGNSITLDHGESTHCLRVLRLGKGDPVKVIDGRGNLYDAIIRNPDPESCGLEISSVQKMIPPRNFKLHIAIAPTKSIDRFEWFVEKAVEIGIERITPLICSRSERRLLKTERLRKIVTSSMKQANVFHAPLIDEMTDFSEFLHNSPEPVPNKFIAHCSNSERLLLTRKLVTGVNAVFLIGPEGDFTEIEIEQAKKLDFQPVSLGQNRLRTETAGLLICSLFNLLNAEQ